MTLASAQMWVPTLEELHRFAPELILVGTIIAVLLVPLVTGRRSPAIAAVVIAGALAALFVTYSTASTVGGSAETAFAPPMNPPMLVVDGLTVFYRFLLMSTLVLVAWLYASGGAASASGPGPIARAAAAPEFFILLLTSALGMLLMVSSLNLLMVVIAMETASLPSYAIVASNKRSHVGAEAALKYVMFGAAASAIMVYGVSLIYGLFGTLDMPRIVEDLQMYSDRAIGRSPANLALFWVGLIAIAAGVTYKIAAVPMHLWCPDVFEGAPTEVTTWLSIASKAAGIGLLLRLADVFATAGGIPSFTPIAITVGIVASITCTVGNLAALRQESVKRTLAYSSIAHAGYMMMAVALFEPRGAAMSGPGVSAIIAYLLVYVAMNVGAFGVTAMVEWKTGSEKLAAFTGLGRRAPWLALPMAVCLFSLVGLPPLGGFAAKWFLLVALGKGAASQPWLWYLVIVAVLNTVVSLYYYVRIIRQMYLRDDASLAPLPTPIAGAVLANVCAVALLLLGTLLFNTLGQKAALLAIGFGQHAAS